MKLLDKIVLFSLIFLAYGLKGQGEFYTINHDTQVILKSSEKPSKIKKYYANEDEEDIVIFRKGLDRAIKLKGKLDLISSSVEFEISNARHSISISDIDSLYVGFIPDNIDLMQAVIYVNASILSDENESYLEVIEDGKVRLYRQSLVKVRRANYNKALSIGNKEDKYTVRYGYFIFNEKGKLLSLPKKFSKKNFVRFHKQTWAYFEDKGLTDELLKCEKEEQLKILIKYLNK